MLSITIPTTRLYNEVDNEFITVKGQTLQLEHSLVSLSKWESKWRKPFLDDEQKLTDEETIDYVRCMTITQNVNPLIYECLNDDHIAEIQRYIDAPMTATWFGKTEDKGSVNGEKVTNEIIYYWMSTFGIPMDCQKWHLNRLITLIRVFIAKSQKPKPMTLQDRAALNAARKQQYNTKG